MVACGAKCAQAGDWPFYRGPKGDGVSTEVIRTNWSAEPPRRVWSVPLDPALSSLTVSGGRVFTLVRRTVPGFGQEQECVVALDAADGRELWATNFDTAFYGNGGVGDDDGPRSTPAVDGDRVYAFGAYLKLVCLSATNGAVLWRRDFVDQYLASVIQWQNAASPVIDGDLLFVNCNASTGRLLAVDKWRGTNRWRVQVSDRMTHATPVVATLEGVRQVVFFAQPGLVSVRPQDGGVLWRYGMPYSTSTAASPVVADEGVYASAAYGTGAGLVKPVASGGQFTTTEVWRVEGGYQNHWSTPVYWRGHFYGHYNQSQLNLVCLDAAAGVERWAVGGFGYGSVLLVGERLLVLSEDGELVLVEPDPTEYREIARHRALTGKCWNAPAISNGRIYVRSTVGAVCLDVSVPPPLLALEALPRSLGEPMRFRVKALNGEPLTADALAGAAVLATANPGEPLAQWATLSLTPIRVDGGFVYEDPEATNLVQRSYLLRP